MRAAFVVVLAELVELALELCDAGRPVDGL
jgi:hypothetical protein